VLQDESGEHPVDADEWPWLVDQARVEGGKLCGRPAHQQVLNTPEQHVGPRGVLDAVDHPHQLIVVGDHLDEVCVEG
jgi:hypothetical protein